MQILDFNSPVLEQFQDWGSMEENTQDQDVPQDKQFDPVGNISHKPKNCPLFDDSEYNPFAI